jgi:hypothetical protein
MMRRSERLELDVAMQSAPASGCPWALTDGVRSRVPAAVARSSSVVCYNTRRKLILTDTRLDHLAIGGRFRPTEPDRALLRLP